MQSELFPKQLINKNKYEFKILHKPNSMQYFGTKKTDNFA